MSGAFDRALEVVETPWSLLVLPDVWTGLTRFEQIRTHLGISRKVLTGRLEDLVRAGVLERRAYDRRPRFDYLLTGKGSDLVDVLLVLTVWGDRWRSGGQGPPALYRHRACGGISAVALRCAGCGGPMHARDVREAPGPHAAA